MTVNTRCSVKCEVIVPVTSDSWSDKQPMEQVIREAKGAAHDKLVVALGQIGGRVVGEMTIVVTMEHTP
jgi:hypothetical protein